MPDKSTENSPDVERRLMDLEVKASFADDLLDQLNQTIVLHQRQIDRLTRELADLRQQVPDEEPGGAPRSLLDELPPHY